MRALHVKMTRQVPGKELEVVGFSFTNRGPWVEAKAMVARR